LRLQPAGAEVQVGFGVSLVRTVAVGAILCVGLSIVAVAPACAQNATWKSSPGSNDFNTGANWTGGSVPTGTASFGSSSTTDLVLSTDATLRALTFNAGAPAYSIATGGNILTLLGTGIVNNSSNAPTIDASGGALGFGGAASAGNAVIDNSAGVVAFGNNASAGSSTITATNNAALLFFNRASAGDATIRLNSGAGIQFTGQSDAGNARITLQNTSSVFFASHSGAGDATITVQTGSGLGFFGSSTAGNATIRALDAGTVLFFQHGTGGNARFIADQTSVIDFSGSAGQNGIVTAGSIEGAGTFVIGNNFQVGGNNLTTEVTGRIVGCGCFPGALTKVGTGTLILSGNNTYTGSTTIAGGTLQVDGTIAKSSVVRVEDGGTLSGTGKVSDVVVKSGGTLAPGDGVGTLTVKGDLTFKDGSNYAVDVSPNAADRTDVSGAAKLNGTVFANLLGGSFITRQFTILSADGGRTGKFDELDLLGLKGFTGSLSYTSTDVILHLTAALGAQQQLGGNQANVSNAIDTFFNNGGALPPAFVTLFGLKGPALGKALAQVSGEAATGAPTIGFQSMNVFLNAMLNPFSSGMAMSGAARGFAQAMSPQFAAASAYAMVPSSSWPRDDKRWSLWATTYGGRSYLDGDPSGTGSHSVSSGAYGVIAGADYRATPDTWLGFAVSGGGNNWDLSNSLGGGDGAQFQLGAYGVHSFGAAYVAAALGFGWHHVDTDRTVTVAGVDKLSASFDAQNLGGRIEGGYRFATGLGTVTPYVAVQAQTYWLPSYGETASSGAPTFALNYSSESLQAFRTELGSWFEKTFPVTGTGLFALRGRLAWAHDANDDPRVRATFQSLPGANFIVTGASAPSDSALVTGAAELRLPDNLVLAVRLDGEFAGSAQTYAASAELRKSW
jgi:autotransporter-associated beta strand protein